MWYATSEPQRRRPRGGAGVAGIGQPVPVSGSDLPNPYRWRT